MSPHTRLIHQGLDDVGTTNVGFGASQQLA